MRSSRPTSWPQFVSAAVVVVLLGGCQSGETQPAITPSATLQGSVRGDANGYLRLLPRRIHFFDAQHGLVETLGGQVLETSDAGFHWRSTAQRLPFAPRLAQSSAQPRRMYAVRSHLGLARSGQHRSVWRQVYPRPPGPPAGPVSYSSERNGIGARSEGLRPDGGVIVATNDGGRTWRPRSRIRGYHVRQLERASATVVWAVAARPMRNRGGYSRSRLFRSDDGGRSWRPVAAPPLGFGTLSVVDRRTAFLYGEAGTLRTLDGGTTWGRLGRHSIYGAGFLDALHGYATRGDDRLVATSDGGKTWQPVALPDGFRVLDVSAHAPDRVWLTGERRILRSDDGGRHWTQIGFDTAPPQPAQWDTAAFGVVPYGVGGHYRTLDGGRTWRFVVATVRRDS